MNFNFKQRYDGIEIEQIYVDMKELKSKKVEYELKNDNILIPLKTDAYTSDEEYENDFYEKIDVIRTSLKSPEENFVNDKMKKL